jgi:hypothetical protein
LPPRIRKEIERCEFWVGDADAVMRRRASEAAPAATEWSEGHAPRPKRVADDPSFV